jgi:hypothetical protein
MQGKLNQFEDGTVQNPLITEVKMEFSFGDSPTKEYGVVDNRGQAALVSTRLRDEHLYLKEMSYNFTKMYLENLRGVPDAIYVVEKERGTVFEWDGDQLTGGNELRIAPNGSEQLGLKTEYAAEWETHAEKFMQPVRRWRNG